MVFNLIMNNWNKCFNKAHEDNKIISLGAKTHIDLVKLEKSMLVKVKILHVLRDRCTLNRMLSRKENVFKENLQCIDLAILEKETILIVEDIDG
ncbi:hypothetical protein CR513_18907, partial [Mucuna pruriens]